MAGEGEEVADGGGDGGEGRGAGVDHGAEHAGGEGFAGAGGTLEDEEGEWSVGAEGGEKPGEAAEPGGAGGEVEAGAEGVQGAKGRGLGAGLGCGERDGGAGGLEEDAGAGGGLPSVGRDLDILAIRVGEIEEDVGGDGTAEGSDTTPDVEAPIVLVVVVGLGFEVIEEGVESAGSGREVVSGVEFVEEPVAKGGGANGQDAEAAGGGDGEAEEGLAVGGGEDGARFGGGDKPVEGIGLWHKFLSIPG